MLPASSAVTWPQYDRSVIKKNQVPHCAQVTTMMLTDRYWSAAGSQPPRKPVQRYAKLASWMDPVQILLRPDVGIS